MPVTPTPRLRWVPWKSHTSTSTARGRTSCFPSKLVREAQELAAKRFGGNFGQAIQQIIASGNFLEKVQAGGGKIIVDQDNELREVVREPQAV